MLDYVRFESFILQNLRARPFENSTQKMLMFFINPILKIQNLVLYKKALRNGGYLFKRYKLIKLFFTLLQTVWLHPATIQQQSTQECREVWTTFCRRLAFKIIWQKKLQHFPFTMRAWWLLCMFFFFSNRPSPGVLHIGADVTLCVLHAAEVFVRTRGKLCWAHPHKGHVFPTAYTYSALLHKLQRETVFTSNCFVYDVELRRLGGGCPGGKGCLLGAQPADQTCP